MALTYPAAFCFENASDTATITVPGSLPLTPPPRLQNPHTSVRCRVEADTMAITVALAAAVTVDTFGLFGIGSNFTTAAVTRIRASLTDPSALDGAVYDSGSAAGRVSSYYGNLVGLRDGAASAKYILFNLTQVGAAFAEGGYVMIGPRHQALINFAPGATDTPVDPSIKTRSRSQAVHIDPRPKYRKWNFSFEMLSKTERMGWVEDMDQVCGSSQNVMVVRDCSSDNLGRDTMCGLITQGAPVISRDGFIDDANAYSKSYELETRL